MSGDKIHGARPFRAGDFCYHVTLPPCPKNCFSNDLEIRARYLGTGPDASASDAIAHNYDEAWRPVREEEVVTAFPAAASDEMQRAIVSPAPSERAHTALRILNLLNLIVLEIRAANVPVWQVVADACETMGKKIEETT